MRDSGSVWSNNVTEMRLRACTAMSGQTDFKNSAGTLPTAFGGGVPVYNTDDPLPNMSKNRQGELTALTSPRFSAALKARNVVLVTYREVIAKDGLKSMRRPVG